MAELTPAPFTTRCGRVGSIRSAIEADAQPLFEYLDHIDHTSDFNVTEPGTRQPTDVMARISELQVNPSGLFLVAEIDRRIIGELSFHGHRQPRIAHHGHFGISVHADWRSRGVGSALIRTLLNWARAHPVIEKVCLGVFAENTHAIALYRRMGFWEEGRRDREFKLAPDRYMDDIQMSHWVKPRPE